MSTSSLLKDKHCAAIISTCTELLNRGASASECLEKIAPILASVTEEVVTLEIKLVAACEALREIQAKSAFAGYDSGDSGIYQIATQALTTLN